MPINPINPLSFIKNAINGMGKQNKQPVNSPYQAQSTTNPLGAADASTLYTVNKNRMPKDVKDVLLDFRRTCNDSTIYSKKIKRQAEQVKDEASKALGKIEKSVIPDIEDIQEEASIIFTREQKKYHELQEKYETGDFVAPNGKTVRKITKYPDGSGLMEEYSKDGKKLLSCTKFEHGKPLVYAQGYREYPDGTQKVEKRVIFADGKPHTYEEGYEEAKDGTERITRAFEFSEGSLSLYTENLISSQESPKGSIETSIAFDNGAILWYQEGYSEMEDGSEKTEMEVRFNKSAKPYLLQEGYISHPDGSEEIAREMVFSKSGALALYQENFAQNTEREKSAKSFGYDERGELSTYLEDYQNDSNGVEKIGRYIAYDSQGEISFYQEGYRNAMDYTTSVKKEIEFTDGKPVNYVQNCEEYSDGTVRASQCVECGQNGKPERIIAGLDPDFETIEFAYEKTDNGWEEMSDDNLEAYFGIDE